MEPRSLLYLTLTGHIVRGLLANSTQYMNDIGSPMTTEQNTTDTSSESSYVVNANDVTPRLITGSPSLLTGLRLGIFYEILIIASVGLVFMVSVMLCVTSCCFWRKRRIADRTAGVNLLPVPPVMKQMEFVSFLPEEAPDTNGINYTAPKDPDGPATGGAPDLENGISSNEPQPQDPPGNNPSGCESCLSQDQESTM